MPLKIYTSNRMERLVDRLEQVLRTPHPEHCTPFTKEIIVAKNKGMQRWLSMELARRIGVFANCDFKIPGKMVDAILARVLPDAPADGGLFRPEVMAWRLMGLLREAIGEPGFGEISSYLGDDGDGLKRMQLAQRLAETFERYIEYRPKLLLAWEAGKDKDWQAELWRRLASGASQKHRARLYQDFLALPNLAPLKGHQRISMIGVATLPPWYLEVLAAAARHIEVNLFLLNPCREFWGDIVSEKKLDYLKKVGAGPDEWFETGNPLLASWGKQGKEFLNLAIDTCGGATDDSFVEIPTETVLHALQGDILDLRGGQQWRRQLGRQDDSLLVHSCHSPMREVEVLHDTLLAIFDADPTLSPRDILVMTPNIEEYAPYISAVFDTPGQEKERIPYSIADRSRKSEGEAAQALLAILRLVGGRYGVSTVLDILQSPPVARRFGMSGDDLETVRGWLRGTNIRWGIDGGQRGEQGLPAFPENSWQAGLDRLLLGYAINGEGRFFFNGILPFDDMEGGVALVLGRFISFCEKLFARTRALARPRGTAAWEEALRELLAEFLLADLDGEREILSLIELARRLKECGEQGAFEGEVSIEVVRYWLEEQLERSDSGMGFLTGAVTFCAMVPMRSIPFPVIALIGMDDGAFPKMERKQAFDRMAQEWLPCDKSKRDEDRYLFLEALLSARQRLHISYVGQSIKDNSEIPPSVLVSELLDYLGKSFITADQRPYKPVLHHPLQPFSPKYFQGDAPLFSYSQHNYRGALSKLNPQQMPLPFLKKELEPWEEESTVTLRALIDFLCSPAKALLRRRLGIRIDQGVEPLEECEPFCLPPLVKYQLEQEIVAALLRGEELDSPYAVACGRGELPPGECGAALFDRLSEPAAEFAAKVAEAASGDPLPPLEVDIKLPGGRIIGRIASLRSGRMVQYRYTKLKAKDQLRLWVEHLALNCAKAEGYPLESTFLAADATIELPAIHGCEKLLDQLLALYRKGMGFPVKFFPETSLEYAKKARDPKKASRALPDARAKWHGNDFNPGECKDEHCRRIFGEQEPLDQEFIATALAVWEPLLNHQNGKAKV